MNWKWLTTPVLVWVSPVHADPMSPLAPGIAPLRVLLSLAVVVVLIGLLALLLRRFPGVGMGRAGDLRLLGTMAVGSRERVVLVETGGSRVLLGVAPGRVQTLHVLPAEGGRATVPDPHPDRTEPASSSTRSVG